MGLIEAGAVALLTISASSAFAAGEMVSGARASFDMSASEAPLFHTVNIGMTALAALTVLIPSAPLMAIALNANLLWTILMPAALVFLLILANDQEVMGSHKNTRMNNGLGIGICATITLAASAAACAGFISALHITI